MKCPCCKGEVVLEVLARAGGFTLDLECQYCAKTGRVRFVDWFKFIYWVFLHQYCAKTGRVRFVDWFKFIYWVFLQKMSRRG